MPGFGTHCALSLMTHCRPQRGCPCSCSHCIPAHAVNACHSTTMTIGPSPSARMKSHCIPFRSIHPSHSCATHPSAPAFNQCAPACQSACLPKRLPANAPACQSACLPTRLPAKAPACQRACLPKRLPANAPACQSACLPMRLPANAPACLQCSTGLPMRLPSINAPALT